MRAMHLALWILGLVSGVASHAAAAPCAAVLQEKGGSIKEREKAAKTADEVWELALECEKRKLKADLKRLVARTLELDPQHAAANAHIGNVQHKGRWMTPAERDAAVEAELAAEMAKKGLVRWQDKWVTPEEKSHYEKGEVLYQGVWMLFADAQRKQGLEEHAGQWLPRAEALARNNGAEVQQLVGVPLTPLLNEQLALYAQPAAGELVPIAAGLLRGRAWFDTTFAAPPGLDLLGGRLAEFYVFVDDEPYTKSVPLFAARTKTVGAGWDAAVAKSYGFFWSDPYPTSSVRLWKRGIPDLAGHCYHHWGHLLANRLGYDGRLLPPWYDEGLACLLEFRSHGRNAVFCRGNKLEEPTGPTTGGPLPKRDTGTKVGPSKEPRAKVAPLDPKAMRDGRWKEALAAGIDDLPSFDTIASLQFTELDGAAIAASMGIVEWLESRGEGALRRFHDVLRKNAPAVPERVHSSGGARRAMYEAAFRAAVQLSLDEADKAWREWLKQK